MRPPPANRSQPRQSTCPSLGETPAEAAVTATTRTAAPTRDPGDRTPRAAEIRSEQRPENGAEGKRAERQRVDVLKEAGREPDPDDHCGDHERCPPRDGRKRRGEREAERRDRDETVERRIRDGIERRAHRRRIVERRPGVAQRLVRPGTERDGEGSQRRQRRRRRCGEPCAAEGRARARGRRLRRTCARRPVPPASPTPARRWRRGARPSAGHEGTRGRYPTARSRSPPSASSSRSP